MHSKSDIIEIMIDSETDEIIEELFAKISKSIRKINEFFFYIIDILYYNVNKISLDRGGS